MITVAVLRGGPSSEHELSLKTGAAVLQHLDHERYRPIDVYLDRQGMWYVRGIPMTPERALVGTDAVFNALHGQYGEDGTLQRILDRLAIPYTGSGALASATAMNKATAKVLLGQQGVRMARSLTLGVSPELDRDITEAFRAFPLPAAVKPDASGSSIGFTIARSFAEFAEGIRNAFKYSARVLIEEYVGGVSATVAVVDTFRGVQHYPLLPVGTFSRNESAELQRLALIAHETLGLRHYSDSDFMVTPRGIYYLETNTVPSLAHDAAIPQSLAAVSITIPEFIDHLITLAVDPSGFEPLTSSLQMRRSTN